MKRCFAYIQIHGYGIGKSKLISLDTGSRWEGQKGYSALVPAYEPTNTLLFNQKIISKIKEMRLNLSL
jgi:hypothetical protein